MQKIDLVAGIDIGGTNTEIGLVNKTGDIIFSYKLKTKKYQNAEDLIKDISDFIKNITRNSEYNLLGIGIGVPNGNYFTGNVEYAANLKWKTSEPIKEYFEKRFDENVKIIITNDANASAVGEYVFGNAKNEKNFIVVTLGTGLGAGIFINGKLHYGNDGYAGELGHITVIPNGRKCNCGNLGCLETYVSATGIKRNAIELLSVENCPSKLRDIAPNSLSAKMIEEFALNGDKIALDTFEYTGEILGKALANISAILNPAKIFIHGGLSKSGDLLFNPAEYHMNKHLLQILKNKVKIEKSGLIGKNTAVLGASALVWNEIIATK